MKTSYANKIAWAIITILYMIIQLEQNRILPQDFKINVELYYIDFETS